MTGGGWAVGGRVSPGGGDVMTNGGEAVPGGGERLDCVEAGVPGGGNGSASGGEATPGSKEGCGGGLGTKGGMGGVHPQNRMVRKYSLLAATSDTTSPR